MKGNDILILLVERIISNFRELVYRLRFEFRIFNIDLV